MNKRTGLWVCTLCSGSLGIDSCNLVNTLVACPQCSPLPSILTGCSAHATFYARTHYVDWLHDMRLLCPLCFMSSFKKFNYFYYNLELY